jgi:hypothetical protein
LNPVFERTSPLEDRVQELDMIGPMISDPGKGGRFMKFMIFVIAI